MIEPSSQSLISAVRASLRGRISHEVKDPWAASELRSIDAVLSLVEARLVHEPEAIRQENVYLTDLLHHMSASGMPVPNVPETNDPRALNHALQSTLADLLPLIHDGSHQELVLAARDHLIKVAELEAPIYQEITSRRPV